MRPLVYAPIWRRAVALPLDLGLAFCIAAVPLGVYFFLEDFLGSNNLAAFLIVKPWLVASCVTQTLYFVLWEISDAAATPGKRLMGLTVVTLEGKPLTFWRSLIRYVLSILAFVTTVWTGIACALFSRRRQMLHDLMTGTVVVEGTYPEVSQHFQRRAKKPIPASVAPTPPRADERRSRQLTG